MLSLAVSGFIAGAILNGLIIQKYPRTKNHNKRDHHDKRIQDF